METGEPESPGQDVRRSDCCLVDGSVYPRMSGAEAAAYSALLGNSDVVLEYGSGGSTLLAVASPAKKIFSVESDSNWIDKLRRDGAIGAAERSGRLRLFHADIGPVGEWGMPDGPIGLNWRSYPLGIWERIGSDVPDLCLVDGRFRVACALSACVNEGFARRTIAIHDFWNRDYYHSLFPFLDLKARIDTFGIFAPKPGVARSVVIDLLNESLSDAR
ncbi:MAG: hypothetical protein WEB63_05415 [Cucumibacter sp.]